MKNALITTGLIACWIILVGAAEPMASWAQNRTTVTLNGDGPRIEAQDNATEVLTALNVSAYYEREPTIAGVYITDAGQQAIERAWAEAQFSCPQTELIRDLEPHGTDRYAIRDIPLIQGRDDEREERRGVLLIATDGRVDGFVYESAYQRPAPPTPPPTTPRVQVPEVEPATGAIVIRTIPDGATVRPSIENEAPQQSPTQFENVPAGEYTFTIRADKHQPIVDTTLTVRAGASTTYDLQLTPDFGFLAVSGSTTGSTFRLDGTDRAPVPGEPIEVPVGPHTISVTKEYFEPLDTTVTVPPGETVTLDARLERKQVPLRVRSDPAGATVNLSGQAAGSTPWQTTLDAGRSYTLQVNRDGYLPSETVEVFAEPDAALERVVVLTPVVVRAEDEGVQLANLRFDRRGETVTIRYDLEGDPDEKYEVQLDVLDPEDELVEIDPGQISGALGKDQRAGASKQIAWRAQLPEGAQIQMTVGEQGGRRLWYLLGGAAAAGGGTAAYLLLKPPPEQGGFPLPPGLPGGN